MDVAFSRLSCGADRAHRRAAPSRQLHRPDGLLVQARLRQAAGQAAEDAGLPEAQGFRDLPQGRARDRPAMMMNDDEHACFVIFFCRWKEACAFPACFQQLLLYKALPLPMNWQNGTFGTGLEVE